MKVGILKSTWNFELLIWGGLGLDFFDLLSMVHSHPFLSCIVCIRITQEEQTNTSEWSFSSLLMNNYRNIAWVFGMKIYSFKHNSLDFIAVLFCYVFSHCGRCKCIWRLVSYFNVWNISNVSYSGLTFTSLSEKQFLPMIYSLYGTQKTLVCWYACINPLVCAIGVLLKRNIPTYCYFMWN